MAGNDSIVAIESPLVIVSNGSKTDSRISLEIPTKIVERFQSESVADFGTKRVEVFDRNEWLG